MLLLKYHKTDATATAIKERLQEMTLAFQEEQQKQKKTISLSDDTQSFEGLEAIQAYLDDVQKDLKGWYYCNC